ncbi:hypothetical protein LPJ57_002012, partial [Coemansia sp. RSA 486]
TYDEDGTLNLNLSPGSSYVAIVMMYLFVISFATSWGPIAWLYPSEIFPMHIRSKANSITTASNWLFNFIIGLVAPILIKKITWGLDLIFAIIMFAAIGIIYVFFPETQNRSLEDMEVIFTGSIWAHKDKKRVEDFDNTNRYNYDIKDTFEDAAYQYGHKTNAAFQDQQEHDDDINESSDVDENNIYLYRYSSHQRIF